METLFNILKYAPEALTALLAILGGLKVFARYTKSEADDKILEKAEAGLNFALKLFKKSDKNDESK